MPHHCPLCHAHTRLGWICHDYPIHDCPVCGHRFVAGDLSRDHVDTVYSDEYFFGGGAGYPDYLGESRILLSHGRRYGRMLQRWQKPGRILDVGSAAGFLLKGYIETGWTGIGIEPNATMAAHARNKLGVDVRTGTLDTVGFHEQFDAVSMIQVLAHYPDPMAAFKIADKLTKPGGVWLMETWNAESRMARLLGQNWHEYSPPSVLHWWNPITLRCTMNRLGYRLLATGYPQKWIGLGHARSLVEHKYGNRWPAILARLIPQQLAVPYPSEDLFWAVYRKG